ncbi:hypothetical protein HGRIS_010808 [Hohenbuehelia grisea]|uniref:Cation/H+ exchanger transmembrane domain-containing protein n=1 Tax=Hohenbuehelia grisea TaxID=104357 RepID=A0ABR3IXU7_9AGAR
MSDFAYHLGELGRNLLARAAPEQTGILSGDNPARYNEKDPIRLWVIQIVVIIGMAQLLGLITPRIRQPRVIAEVVGGLLLGPTVMGRIPGFRDAIFPAQGMVLLNLTSSIGLVLFLFLVALEIDTRLLKRNMRRSAVISLAGLILPLGLGAALGVVIYKNFIDQSVNYGYFLLFVAVAISITAFPVLCRILTELKLLDTSVGITVLSAGVVDDVVGWVLLALTVTLVNASNGLTALYVLLTCVGYVLFLLFPGRWAYRWLAVRTGSLDQGSPTPFMMTVTLLTVFISAFFTDIIGVHAIFGGFIAGLIIPHDNGYAIAIVEKLEDLVTIILIPIFFTLSGLRTNIGLLDDGKTWGYTILICAIAFVSKFFGCGGAAKFFGFNWREAATVGSLMSCKGLVELIVLNVGLQAGILDPRTFSMFVVHAIVLTIITTPLTLFFYPPKYRVHEGPSPHGIKSSESGEEGDKTKPHDAADLDFRSRYTLILDRLEQLPSAMAISKLLQPPSAQPSVTSNPKAAEAGVFPGPSQAISMNALRLVELTDRTSTVLRSQEAEGLLLNDPLVSAFKTFSYLNNIPLSAALSVTNFEEFPLAITEHANESKADLVILPWSRTSQTLSESLDGDRRTGLAPTFDQTNSVVHSELVRKVFMSSPSDVALFVDRGLSLARTGLAEQHLFLPFFGGPDDRLALSFVVQLCTNTSIKATVLRILKTDALSETTTNIDGKGHLTHNTIAPETVYGQQSTETRLMSDTADNVLWDRYTRDKNSQPSDVVAALSRVTFQTTETGRPLRSVVDAVEQQTGPQSSGNLVVVLGRSRRLSPTSNHGELLSLVAEKGSSVGSALPRTLGDVGAALIASNVSASLLVMQAAVA